MENRENREKIVFDTESGISLEEQEAVFAELDTLTRSRLENDYSTPSEKEAKKQGILLPLLINAVAILLLAGGFLVFFAHHKQKESQFKAGDSPLGGSERKLIEEIRNETADKLQAKDEEIAVILAKLAEIDGDIQNLQVQFDKKALEKENELSEKAKKDSSAERDRLNKQNLTASLIDERMRNFDAGQIERLNTELANYKAQLEAEKQNAQAKLQNLKDDFQAKLTALQQERGKLLEDARVREANLHKQIETNEKTQSELNSVQEQIKKLTGENEKNALIDTQLEAYYTSVKEQINEGRFNEALSTIAAMKDFLNTPSFQNLKLFQAQKASRLVVINAFSDLIDKSKQLAAGSPSLTPQENSPPTTDNDKITPKNVEESENYEKKIAELEKTVADQDRTITSYKNQGKNLSAQETTINTLTSQVAGLQGTVAESLAAANELKAQNTTLQQSLATANTTLADLQQIVTARENSITELRDQVSSLQQTVTARDASINELRTQNTSLQQTAEQLRQQNDAIRELLNN